MVVVVVVWVLRRLLVRMVGVLRVVHVVVLVALPVVLLVVLLLSARGRLSLALTGWLRNARHGRGRVGALEMVGKIELKQQTASTVVLYCRQFGIHMVVPSCRQTPTDRSLMRGVKVVGWTS